MEALLPSASAPEMHLASDNVSLQTAIRKNGQLCKDLDISLMQCCSIVR